MTDILEQLQPALAAEYRVERELGGGGMSRVFLAEEIGLGRRVVIKVLPPELAGSVSLERFRREIHVAAGLQHPHIVPMLRAGQAGDMLYYAMPFVDGESLRSRLERGRIPPVEAARILRDVADALAYAHRRGVTHRDIKPDNILLSGSHALVTDFGVARALGAGMPTTLTATGIAIGTPLYMAPEQAAGDPAADHRVDLYALGVVAYEMLVGEPPFSGITPQAILASQLTERVPPLRRRAPETPPQLAALVDACLRRDPDGRASAEELMGPLAAVATPSGSAAAGRVTGALKARVVARRVAPIALVSLALVMLAGWEMRQRGAARRLLDTALPLVADGRFDAISDSVAATGADLASRRLRPLALRVAGRVVIEAPRATSIDVVRVTPIIGFSGRPPARSGPSPLSATLVAGQYLVRFAGAGSSLQLLITIDPGSEEHLSAVELAPDTAGAFVSAGGFLISRTEVTNAEYQRFVAAGGYRDSALWRADAAQLRRFVDRSGVPGPANWFNGAPPPGEERHPVTGVSWHEAAAYASWAGGRLPTQDEWYRAALGSGDQPFPWGLDAATAEQRANFGGVGTVDAGSSQLGVSPAGAHDMAGNAREWLDDQGPRPGTRLTAGGSWQEPSYGFERGYAEALDAAVRRNSVGFRIARDSTGGRQ